MLRKILIIALSAGIGAHAFSSCRHEPFDPEKGNFPAEISRIMINKCATTGCHDAAGAVNAARLRLDSWDELFKGSSHGAVAVPYSPKFSSLLYYLNDSNFTNNDLTAEPRMPYNQSALSEEEYNTIKNWIANGAPDAKGNIPFASDADIRQKVYLTQQNCDDLVTVIDSKSGLVMRYIPIGVTLNTEVAHSVKFSKDGRYAYVCFYEGGAVHKIDTREDRVVATANIDGAGGWSAMNISPDGSQLLVTGLKTGAVILINTATMSVIENFNGIFTQPHGIVATSSFDTLYITSQSGNVIYRYILSLFDLEQIAINDAPATTSSETGITPDPHDILMTPDYSRMFITCQNNKEVKVMDMATEQIIATIPVGSTPKEIAISKKRNLAFITCMEDPDNHYSVKSRGSVYVVDINTLQKVGGPIYGDFYQPHGIVVDEQNNLIYIASSNVSTDGPAPHHASACDGRNGWYSIYDLSTLQPFNNIRYETTPYPYGADVRFK